MWSMSSRSNLLLVIIYAMLMYVRGRAIVNCTETPCSVVCDGTNVICGNATIDGSHQTSLTVQCNQTDSCQDTRIHCPNNGECNLQCLNTRSCENVVFVPQRLSSLNVECGPPSTSSASCVNLTIHMMVTKALNLACIGVRSCAFLDLNISGITNTTDITINATTQNALQASSVTVTHAKSASVYCTGNESAPETNPTCGGQDSANSRWYFKADNVAIFCDHPNSCTYLSVTVEVMDSLIVQTTNAASFVYSDVTASSSNALNVLNCGDHMKLYSAYTVTPNNIESCANCMDFILADTALNITYNATGNVWQLAPGPQCSGSSKPTALPTAPTNTPTTPPTLSIGWTISNVNMLYAEFYQCVGTFNHSIYIVGGNGGRSSVMKYNIAANAFTLADPLSNSGVYAHSQSYTQIEHKLYMISNWANTNPKYIYIYNMQTEQYIIDYFPQIPIQPRDTACLASTSQYLYVLGGMSGPDVQVLDIANKTWQNNVPSMQVHRQWFGCIVEPNSKYLYAIGGKTDDRTIERVQTNNITAHAWRNIAGKFPSSKIHHIRCIIYRNHIWVIGGYYGSWSSPTYIRDVYMIDTVTGDLSISPDQIKYDIYGAASIIASGKVFVFGGGYATSSKRNTFMYYRLNQLPTSEPTLIPTSHPTEATLIPTYAPTNPSVLPSYSPTKATLDPTNPSSDHPSIVPIYILNETMDTTSASNTLNTILIESTDKWTWWSMEFLVGILSALVLILVVVIICMKAKRTSHHHHDHHHEHHHHQDVKEEEGKGIPNTNFL
eukprot:166915_1